MKELVIKSQEQLDAIQLDDGILRIESDLIVECDIVVKYPLVVSGYADFRGEYLVVSGDMYWAVSSMPKMPEKTYIKRILPPSYQKEHWQDRIGIDFGDYCYESIIKKMKPQMKKLLADTKWSKTEMWMLETLANSKNPAPEWVNSIKAEKS